MIDLLFLAVAISFIGTGAAGLWDLLTTEIPDEIPLLMIVSGIVIWFAAGSKTGNFWPLGLSLGLGTAVFLIGWGLYMAGKWGGGDAAVFASIFYLMPDPNFLLSYIINFFAVSLAYVIVYATGLGVLHPKIFGYAAEEMRVRKGFVPGLMIFIVCGFAATAIFAVLALDWIFIGSLWGAAVFFMLFWIYARAIERRYFRRRISVSKLKVGDVPADFKRWDGVDKDFVDELKRKGGEIEIKEGVRFGPVFVINLAVTLLIGNIIFWIMEI